MATPFRSSNAMLLAKVQSAQGTEASPVPGSDAVRVAGAHPIGYSPNFQRLDTDYANSSISNSPPIVSLGAGAMKLSAYLTPSTTAGAAGDPDYGTFLRGCGTQELKTAADVAGTSTAVAASTITLAAGSSAVDDAYKGMVIDGTSGSINGQRRVITGYVGSTKVATVFPAWTSPSATPAYAIRKNSLYSPVTTGQSLLTIWGYQHHSTTGSSSRRRRIMDAMGNCQISVKPREYAKVEFNFSGVIPAVPDDVAKPSTPTFLGLDPQPLQGAICRLGAAGASDAAASIKFTDFSFDFGNKVANFDDPNAAFGYDSAEVVMRDAKGSITPNLDAIATRDNMSNAVNLTNQFLWVTWGAVGKGISLLIPAMRITNVNPDDGNGWQVEKIEFDATGTDSECYFSVF